MMNAGDSERFNQISKDVENNLKSGISIEKIPFGVESIDKMLGGGIEVGVITEIYGDGGSGKTNLALVLSRSAVLQGGTCVFIDSEGVSPERIGQIFKNVSKEGLERMLILKTHSIGNLRAQLAESFKVLKNSQKPRVLIIDSYGMLYRIEMGYGRSPQAILRNSYPIFNFLQNNAEKYETAVLITNQVYTDLSTESSIELLTLGGKVLSHMARAIIELRRLPFPGYRLAILKKHRSRPENIKAYFKIVEEGLVSVTEEEIKSLEMSDLSL